MDESGTFNTYSRHVAKRLRKDATPWARDNILFAGLMVALPPLIAFVRNPSQSFDWGLFKTTLWLYVAAFGFYLVYQTAKAAWKVDTDRLQVIEGLQTTVATYEEKENRTQSKPSRAEWLSLSDRFKGFPYTRADWQTTSGDTRWTLQEGSIRSLCTLAGSMLLKSHLIETQYPSLISQPNLQCWLSYIKDTKQTYNHFHGEETLSDGTKLFHLMGSVEISTNSVDICIELAAHSNNGGPA